MYTNTKEKQEKLP